MKKFVAFALFALILGCTSVQAVNSEKGFISLSTTSNAEIAPDVAEVSISVQTFDNKSMQKATLQNKEISDKVIAELKTMIKDGDYIKTSNYSANPVYKYVNNKKILDKYQVTNSVVVHTKAIDKVGAMIDRAIFLGATNVNSLSFSVSDYEYKCNDLLEQAAKKAYERANVVAKTIPTTIEGIRSMDVSCSTNNIVRPQYRLLKTNATMDAAGAVEETSTVIESGAIKIFANVNASYFVK